MSGSVSDEDRMSKHLLRDLENLQRQILTQAGDVEDAVYKAIQSLQERDVRLAREVIANDSRIDLRENAIEEECLKILALHQPVARDLRRITTTLLINTDLERIGDLAVNIAERSVALAQHAPLEVPEKLQRMTDLTTGMLRQSLDSFVNLDSKAARRVIRLDEEVDRYNNEIIGDLVVKMKATLELIEPVLLLFSATRHLERIADHTTNIAEDVVYLVEGEIVRHRPEAIGND